MQACPYSDRVAIVPDNGLCLTQQGRDGSELFQQSLNRLDRFAYRHPMLTWIGFAVALFAFYWVAVTVVESAVLP